MILPRGDLTILFNALWDTDSRRISVKHPAEELGELFEITLGEASASSIRTTLDEEDYSEARRAIDQAHGEPAVTEIPEVSSYVNAFLAGGLLAPKNDEEIAEFIEREGHADLSAGHQPVVAGFDTNLMAWRIANVLGLDPGPDAAINGFVVATGVLDELDWNKKRTNTKPLERAFGSTFSEFFNQPAGWRREGRLGETYYRGLRDHRYADEVLSEPGDEEIVSALADYQTENRKTVLLFSNDRDFIERAKSHRVRAQRVTFPQSLPRRVEGSWQVILDTLYILTVLFGVLELPKVTLYGVWSGKGGQAWHDEALKCDCRSPKVESLIQRDVRILNFV